MVGRLTETLQPTGDAVPEHNAFDWACKEVTAGYADTFRALTALSRIFLTVFAIDVVLQLAWWVVYRESGERAEPATALVTLATLVAQVYLTVPLILAIHRFVQLGELTKIYRLPATARPFRQYFASAMPLFLLANVGSYACPFGDASSGLGLVTVCLAMAGAAMLWVRLILLFPAIAAGEETASWRRAVDDLTGRGRRVAAVLGMAMAPIFFAAYCLLAIPCGLLGLVSDPAAQHLWLIGHDLSFIIMWSVAAAIGSRFYQQAPSPPVPAAA